MKLILVKVKQLPPGYTGPILLPMDNDLSGIPDGEIIADLRKNRNVKNHRRFFAFIKMSFDMQDTFDSMEVWRKYITMKAGFFDEVINAEGKVLYWPQSISWDELDEIKFKDLFNKVVDAFLKYYGQDLDDMQINSIVEF